MTRLRSWAPGHTASGHCGSLIQTTYRRIVPETSPLVNGVGAGETVPPVTFPPEASAVPLMTIGFISVLSLRRANWVPLTRHAGSDGSTDDAGAAVSATCA